VFCTRCLSLVYIQYSSYNSLYVKICWTSPILLLLDIVNLQVLKREIYNRLVGARSTLDFFLFLGLRLL